MGRRRARRKPDEPAEQQPGTKYPGQWQRQGQWQDSGQMERTGQWRLQGQWPGEEQPDQDRLSQDRPGKHARPPGPGGGEAPDPADPADSAYPATGQIWPAYGDQQSAQPQPPPGGYPPAEYPPAAAESAPSAGPKRKRRTILVISLVAVLVAVAAAAGGAYFLLRTKGSPQQTASEFLGGWQRHDYRAMNKVSVGLPHGGVAGQLTAAQTQLGVRSARLRLGSVTSNGGTAVARFTVSDRLSSNHTWTYQGVLHLVSRHKAWWVRWSPSAIYPRLKAGEQFTLTSSWPARASILAADGTDLSSAATLAQSGSIGLLVGSVGPATKKQAKALGAPYKAGDPIGQSGIEQAYQARLAGSPSMSISLTGPGKRSDGVLHRFPAVDGKPVRTSIKMSVQLAASQAVLASPETKPIDMVVIQPSTGKVLAMVESPGGWDRAIDGLYPPGSTFKIVTASALAKEGMTPSSPVNCPSKVDIGGYTIHNDKNEALGQTNLLRAFAISCNTTFAQLAANRLTGAKLEAMAKMYGYNSTPALGIPARLGSFVLPSDPTSLAADAFGQGKDLVSPLSQAAEAAAAQSGTWRPPLLVTNPAPKQQARPHKIDPSILATLRPMMHAVVTLGTAAGVGFPPGVYGKTGTAEYNVGSKIRSHGWFIGYDGDLAFAVLVEGGGYGANSAGPIANTFLHKIYG